MLSPPLPSCLSAASAMARLYPRQLGHDLVFPGGRVEHPDRDFLP